MSGGRGRNIAGPHGSITGALGDISVRRHQDANSPLGGAWDWSNRHVQFACEFTIAPDPSTGLLSPRPVSNTIGPVGGGVRWPFDPASGRNVVQWSDAFPATVAGPGTVRPIQAVGASGGVQSDASLAALGAPAPGGAIYPKGTPGVVVAGTDLGSHQPVFLPSFDGLAAPYFGKPDLAGSRVYELNQDGTKSYFSLLQSLMRVCELPGGTQTTTAGSNPYRYALALQYGVTGAGAAGGGYIADRVSGLGEVIASMSARNHGPVEVGSVCKHQTGENSKGEGYRPAHISTRALFYADPIRDAELDFDEVNDYEDAGSDGDWWRTFLRYDPHTDLWRFETRVPLTTWGTPKRPGITDGPTDGGNPGGPTDGGGGPGNPGGPSDGPHGRTKPGGRIITRKGTDGPSSTTITVVPGDVRWPGTSIYPPPIPGGTDPSGQGHGAGPITSGGIDWTGGTGGNNPFGPEPGPGGIPGPDTGGRGLPGDNAGLPVVSGPPNEQIDWTGGASGGARPPAPSWGYDPFSGDPGDPTKGPSSIWGPSEPTDQTAIRERVNREFAPRNLYHAGTWNEFAAPSFLLMAQNTQTLMDVRNLARPNREQKQYIKTKMPVVARLEGYASQAAEIFTYNQQPGSGVYPTGSSQGGYALLPPELRLDVIGTNVEPTTGLSTPHLTAYKAAIGVGTPSTTKGKTTLGHYWTGLFDGSGTSVFYGSSSTGTAAECYRMTTAGVTNFASGGGLVLHQGLDASRTDLPAEGQIYWATDTCAMYIAC